jgi:hypothetical protein
VGVPIAELIRKVGISEQTFYRWKSRRPLVKYLEQSYRVSERHACCVLEVIGLVIPKPVEMLVFDQI